MQKRSIVVAALVPLVMLSACSSPKKPKAGRETPTTQSTPSTLPATEVVATALSPEKDSVQGVGGTGIVVDLAFRAMDANLLAAQPRAGVGGAKPGRNTAFPGLVVTLATTEEALGGPTANLAELFQIVGVAKQPDGAATVWATWANAKPLFGLDVDSVLEAFVVRGEAPPTVPEGRTGLDVISNVVNVAFHVGGRAGQETSPTTVGNGTGRPSTSTTRPRTTRTTVRTTATTARTTGTTTSPPTTRVTPPTTEPPPVTSPPTTA